MNIVIGSGPAGLACAAGLRARGQRVLLLDAGLTLEPERALLRDGLAAPPAGWTPSMRALLDVPALGSDGMPAKRAYGSDFATRRLPGAPALVSPGGLAGSYAQGGLSAVWGAAMLPWRAADLAGWPIGRADLDAGYRAVRALMPMAAVADDLAAEFSLHGPATGALPESRQAALFHVHLARHRAALAARGVRFGAARLAVGPGCDACGHCLSGCPQGLIASTVPALTALIAAGLSYRPGVVVEAFAETAEGVTVTGRTAAGAVQTFAGSRLFIAAGVLHTAGLMRPHWPGARVTLLDSQYFLVPLLTQATAGDVAAAPHHTLAHTFIELDDVHIQIYGYSRHLAATVAAGLGPLARLVPWGRLLLAQAYLPSQRSGSLDVSMADGGLTAVPRVNPATGPAVRQVLRRLMRLAPPLGALALAPLVRITPPGRGFHAGGSFPMRATPGPGETDIWGRPAGFARVHLADASVLPSIATPTITATAMANAWRIGAGAPL